MIKNMRFKNWRSLKDVEINDLTPITVFIGANSSGKTNIIDALRFWRDAQSRGLEHVVSALGYEKIVTDALRHFESVTTTLQFDYDLPQLSQQLIRERTDLQFEMRSLPFFYRHSIWEGETQLDYGLKQQLPAKLIEFDTHVYSMTSEELELKQKIESYLGAFIRLRWQIISEGFAPSQQADRRFAPSPYIIETDCSNWLQMADFMEQAYPEIFEELRQVAVFLIETIEQVKITKRDESLHLWVRESNNRITPLVSLGSRRLLAMLTAIHALDIPQRDRYTDQISSTSMPGLIIIEEPDVALNPWILERFVDQLRNYTSRENNPRQFILTTHNPSFLNYFQPEEVRVVERGEDGFTTVNRIPDYIREIWLNEYGLGQVWTTGSFGGVPQ